MDWDDTWEIVLIAVSLVGMVCIIGLFYKKCIGTREKRRNRRTQVQPISTIQEMYVPAPQYNQNYINNPGVGWNITNVDYTNQRVGINIGGHISDVYDLPRDPVFHGVPYEKPPPYNPNC